MKSTMKKKGTDKLVFQWDQKALSSLNSMQKVRPGYTMQRSLSEYFDFLDEIKPHIHELRHTKMFNATFFLV